MHKTRVLNPLPSAIIPIPDIRIGVISLHRETYAYSSYFFRSNLRYTYFEVISNSDPGKTKEGERWFGKTRVIACARHGTTIERSGGSVTTATSLLLKNLSRHPPPGRPSFLHIFPAVTEPVEPSRIQRAVYSASLSCARSLCFPPPLPSFVVQIPFSRSLKGKSGR